MNTHSSQHYLSNPYIDQETIVFSSAGSIWKTNLEGGLARVLVSGFQRTGASVVDQARRYLVFTASNGGALQIHCLSDRSEAPECKTGFHESCEIRGWNSDGRLLFTTSSGSAFRQVRTSWLLDLDSGELEQLRIGTLSIVHCAADGTRLAGPSAVNPRFWQNYQGGASGEIWLDNQGDGRFWQLPHTQGNVCNPVLFQNRVWFVLDRNGCCNLVSTTRAGDDFRQHTHHHLFPVHSIATDGNNIVYCSGGELFRWAADASQHSINPCFRAQDDFAARSTANSSSGLRLVDGDHRSCLVGVCHNRLFEFPVAGNELSEITGITDCKNAVCLTDGRLLVVAAGTQYDKIFVVGTDRTEVHELLPGTDFGRISLLTVARSALTAVVANHRHQLVLIDMNNTSVSVLDRSGFQPIRYADISADGRLCVYSVAVGQYRTVLRLVNTRDGKLVAETDPQLADYLPRFQHDDTVVFLSMYPSVMDGQGLLTAVHTMQPNDVSDWCSGQFNLTEHDLQIRKIETRQVAFSGLLCAGKHVVLQLPASDNGMCPVSPENADSPLLITAVPGSRSVWTTTAEHVLLCGDDTLAMGVGTDWFIVKIPSSNEQEARSIQRLGSQESFRVKGKVSAGFCVRELLQLVRQYVSQDILASRNWDSVSSRYLALRRIPFSSNEIDLLLNEILGFLATSHAHVSSPADDARPRQALSNMDGAIARCLVGNTMGDNVETESGQQGPTRALAYASWVQQRRQYVRQETAGVVDYYHLPDVLESTRHGFELWLKCRDMPGNLILDVRYNDGGVCGAEIGQLLLNRPLGSVATRRSRIVTHPVGSVRRQIVLLANRFTSSGGELLIAVLRQHAGSIVVGERTYGGGIGHTFSHSLPGGSSVLLPELLVKGPAEWSTIENHGVEPDIAVVETSVAVEKDAILRRAVVEILGNSANFANT